MFFLLSLFNLYSTVHPFVTSPPRVNLTVDIQNVKTQQGAIYVALFRPGKDFPEGKPVEARKVDITGNSAQTTFLIEPGEYAIALFHDENGNGKMDKRVFGIPKEPYGFSNNFRPKMSVPKFSDCQFHVSESRKAISIQLN